MNVTILNSVPFFYLGAFALSVIRAVAGLPVGGRIRNALWIAGFAAHSAGIAFRWVESYTLGIGHAPLSNIYESLVVFSWTVIFFYIVFGLYRRYEEVGSLAVLIAFLLIACASFSPHLDSSIQPLVPALKSNWLISHVITCFLGYGAFVVAAVLGVTLLWRGDRWKDQSPALDERIHQCIIIGFFFFTVGIMTGAVWAHHAWGRYWGWDPKETWALITWLIYAAILHMRLIRRDTRRIAFMTIAGLASSLFTFLGVNYLPGLHAYL